MVTTSVNEYPTHLALQGFTTDGRNIKPGETVDLTMCPALNLIALESAGMVRRLAMPEGDLARHALRRCEVLRHRYQEEADTAVKLATEHLARLEEAKERMRVLDVLLVERNALAAELEQLPKKIANARHVIREQLPTLEAALVPFEEQARRTLASLGEDDTIVLRSEPITFESETPNA